MIFFKCMFWLTLINYILDSIFLMRAKWKLDYLKAIYYRGEVLSNVIWLAIYYYVSWGIN